jgi:hypothetical protein
MTASRKFAAALVTASVEGLRATAGFVALVAAVSFEGALPQPVTKHRQRNAAALTKANVDELDRCMAEIPSGLYAEAAFAGGEFGK